MLSPDGTGEGGQHDDHPTVPGGGWSGGDGGSGPLVFWFWGLHSAIEQAHGDPLSVTEVPDNNML